MTEERRRDFESRSAMQRKPTVGSPSDPYEREADQVADQITRMAEPSSVTPSPTVIQRQCSACDEDEESTIQREIAPSADGSDELDTTAAVRATERGGAPLPTEVLSHFEPRFGHDLSEVRVHVDGEAALAARARAYTVGRDIVFGHGEYAPGTADGQRLLAHELTHVIQQGHGRAFPGGVAPQLQRSAAPAVMRVGAAHGQSSVSSAGTITADLTSPIVVGRAVLLQVDVDPNAPYVPVDRMVNPYEHYFWTVYDRDTNARVTDDWSGSNRKRLVYPRAGHFRVECVFVNPRRGQTAPIKIEQDAVVEDPSLASDLSKDSDYADAERQLVDDFKPYVESAAMGTGPLGITARFLAAVLREEIANTALLPGGASTSRREEKITDVGAAIDKKAAGRTVDSKDIDRSLGVGQVKMSTAAMAEGVMTWTEQAPGGPAQRAPGRAKIDADFAKLSVSTLKDLLAILAWPKSNIAEAAKILAKLKNRPTRYPAMPRADFAANARACQIIATEYNTGATNSAEADAQSAEYGARIWGFMSLPLMQKYFTNG